MKIFYHIGRYSIMLTRVFSKPERWQVFFNMLLKELVKIGLNSIGIVSIISIFIGAVITLQTAYNIEIAFIPDYLVGVTTRDSMILEFSSTIVALILAGKAGANISSEIGMMRVQEQIDALEMMGINSASHLVLPKIISAILIFPMLTIYSIFLGITGGYLITILTNAISPANYIQGLHYIFVPYYITYSIIKMIFFAFFITTIAAYHGYHVRGGAIEVGKAGTKAVVYGSIMILLINMILTELMLS